MMFLYENYIPLTHIYSTICWHKIIQDSWSESDRNPEQQQYFSMKNYLSPHSVMDGMGFVTSARNPDIVHLAALIQIITFSKPVDKQLCGIDYLKFLCYPWVHATVINLTLLLAGFYTLSQWWNNKKWDCLKYTAFLLHLKWQASLLCFLRFIYKASFANEHCNALNTFLFVSFSFFFYQLLHRIYSCMWHLWFCSTKNFCAAFHVSPYLVCLSF